MRIPFSLLILCFLVSDSFAQFKKIKSISVNEEIVSSSVDRPGDLYVTTDRGQILKYDSEGILKFVFKNNPSPTLFDPHDGARMFAYYRKNRKYEYLNPSFESTAVYSIDSAFIIDPWLSCLSGDYNLWLVDASDGSLKKVNTKLGQVEVDVKINDTIKAEDINYMREYQGFVFVLIRNVGIAIFNSMGKQIKTIGNKNITSFNFLGEELYYLQNDRLMFLDLFSTESREMKLPSAANFAILTDERLYLITGKTIDIFKSNL